ncbi:hypothetical protein T439DRAFT_323661 [Meredithblackwellia eburnea MCA 4105]
MLPDARPPPEKRKFVSELVEQVIDRSAGKMRDPDIAQLFRSCYPNTIDTTVYDYDLDLDRNLDTCDPRSWIITGDIPAVWLRDSANQVIPYLEVLSTSPSSNLDGKVNPEWDRLYRLCLGALLSQADCILLHPFSNAFIPPSSMVVPEANDHVLPPPPSGKRGELRVWESKFEVDSLASFIDLSVKLAQSSRRQDFVRIPVWRDAVRLVLYVCRLQQRSTAQEVALLPVPWYGPPDSQLLISQQIQDAPGLGTSSLAKQVSQTPRDYKKKSRDIYRFQRPTTTASETRSLGGLGEPAKRCGLIKSAFRPSDDATVQPFLIPSNAFLSVGLIALADLLASVTVEDLDMSHKNSFESEISNLSLECGLLGKQVRQAVLDHGVTEIVTEGGETARVFAYEVDGFGSTTIADDANLPSLLSLAWFGFVTTDDPIYVATRKLVLSQGNKWYFEGKFASGIGGMHIGSGFVWPMSIIVRALTSDDDEEILDALEMLKSTTSGTGLMHESFHVDNPDNFTRSHFSWANGLFGQLCLHLLATRPHLI